jgi:hypothetical protein
VNGSLESEHRRAHALSRSALPIWALLAVALLASAPLWGPGMVNTRGGGDSPFLLQRTHQLAANLRAGVFPVRWMPDAAYGLGYPFFNYYSALPYYLAGALNLLGFDLLTAIKLTQTLGFLLAALAMYGWVNHLWGRRDVAWLAAAAYSVAPFHLVNVYVRGDSLSEFYAFVFYPLILWALARVVARAKMPGPLGRRGLLEVALLALAYAGLILAHNISAFIFTPFALLYALLLILRSPRRDASPVRRQVRVPRWFKPSSLVLAGLLLGAALAAWAWLPALLERDYVQAENLTGDFFDYERHFRTANLVQPAWLFDYSIQVTTQGPSPFAVGRAQALVAALGSLVLLYLFLRPRLTRQDDGQGGARISSLSMAFVLIGLSLSTAMITPLSRPLWERVPLLDMVQFPWRFLSVQALFTALAAAACLLPLQGRGRWLAGAALAALLLFSTLFTLRPERLSIGPEDVTRARLLEYELFSGNIGTTVRYEWLPRAALPRPFTSDAVITPERPAPVIPITGTLERAQQVARGPTEQVWELEVGEGGASLAFPLLFWPGWEAWLDDGRLPVRAVAGAGYLALDMPPGGHTVRLKLGRTPLRAGAEVISLIALLPLLLLPLWPAFAKIRRAAPTSDKALRPAPYALRLTHHALRITPYLLLLLAVLLLLAIRSPAPSNRPDDLTMDFVAMPYLHHNPAGIPFALASVEDAPIRMLGYGLSAERLRPGDLLRVTSRWEDRRATAGEWRVQLRLVSPAEHLADPLRRFGFPYTLAVSTEPLATTVTHELRVPGNTPPGLYLLQLRLLGSEGELPARTPSGSGRGPLYLRPVRVTEGAPLAPDPPLLALVGPDIRLHTAELEQSAGSSTIASLTARLEWSTGEALASNYAVSVRLLDPDGQQRASFDTQPGYGFAPTSLWPSDRAIADRYILPLPGDLPTAAGYRLLLVFYRHPTLAEIGRVELGPFTLPLPAPLALAPQPRRFDTPLLPHHLGADFTTKSDAVNEDHIRLPGYDLNVAPDALELTLWWVAQRQPRLNYTVFVHLFDPATPEVIVAQHDAMPRGGTHPTSAWLAGEVVSDTVRLALDGVPPGDYRLALGLYDAVTTERLGVTLPDAQGATDDRLILPDRIEVGER